MDSNTLSNGVNDAPLICDLVNSIGLCDTLMDMSIPKTTAVQTSNLNGDNCMRKGNEEETDNENNGSLIIGGLNPILSVDSMQSVDHEDEDNEMINDDEEEEEEEEEAVATKPLSYHDLFPPLPSTAPQANASGAGAWGKAPAFKTKVSGVNCVIVVPLIEQKDGSSSTPNEICARVMKQHNVAIEMSRSKDRTLTLIISGKGASVTKAKKDLLSRFQTSVTIEMKIPRQCHGAILGKGGLKLHSLCDATSTQIKIPRQSDETDIVTITGTRENVSKARNELQMITDEQAKLDVVRMSIPFAFHPFMFGYNNDFMKELIGCHNVRIYNSYEKDDISISGDKDDVAAIAEKITKIYNEKKEKTTVITISLPKDQHKWVVGPKYCNIHAILKQFGTIVNVPSADDPLDLISLRGCMPQLALAVSEVHLKANSVQKCSVSAPAWTHRHLIGSKGIYVKKLNEQFPDVHIKFHVDKASIDIQGSPENVAGVRASLQASVDELCSRLDYAEVIVPAELYRHIIGKGGQNIHKLKDEFNVQIDIPQDEANCNAVRVEGDKEGVKRAVKELEEQVQRHKNLKEIEVKIDSKYHRLIIGQGGANIRVVHDMFPGLIINFPAGDKKTDIITIKGPSEEAQKCSNYLKNQAKEIALNNHTVEVPIFQLYHRNIIGKGGANIKKIRDEFGVKIDVPSENTQNEVIIVTGKKVNCEAARDALLEKQSSISEIVDEEVIIDAKYHGILQGKGGVVSKDISNECGGVIITFPKKGSKIAIRGPVADVSKAKLILSELAEKKVVSDELSILVKYHKHISGRSRDSLLKLRSETGARVVMDPKGVDPIVTVLGTKAEVAATMAKLKELVKALANSVTEEVTVASKFHKDFVRSHVIILQKEFAGVEIIIPKQAEKKETFTVRGPSVLVTDCIARITEIANDLENTITIMVDVPKEHHRAIIGRGGCNIQKISDDNKVVIQLPNGNNKKQGKSTIVNDDEGSPHSPSAKEKENLIQITGLADRCEAAKAAILAFIPETCQMIIPANYHRFIIGSGGKGIRKIMDDTGAKITFPKSDSDKTKEIVFIHGVKTAINAAMEVLEARVRELEKEFVEYELRNFSVELSVEPEYHARIIGSKGAVISKIKEDTETRISFPRKSDVVQNVITIVGYEANTTKAADAIKQIIREQDAQISENMTIDPSLHRRIVGPYGSQIKKLMSAHNVMIKWPQDSEVLNIRGLPENVESCVETLQKLVDDYIAEINEEYEENAWKGAYLAPKRSNDVSIWGDDLPTRAADKQTAPRIGAKVDNNPVAFPSIGIPTTNGSAVPKWF